MPQDADFGANNRPMFTALWSFESDAKLRREPAGARVQIGKTLQTGHVLQLRLARLEVP